VSGVDAAIKFLEPATSTGQIDNELVTTTKGQVLRQRVQAYSGGFFPMRDWSQFYNIRGQRFIATTGYVTNTLNATGEFIALLQNPSDSGKVLVLDKAEFGATVNTRFSRFGGGTAVVANGATPRIVGRTDGVTAPTTPTMKLYTGGTPAASQFSVSAPGNLRKVAAMSAYRAYQLNDIRGTTVLNPGQQSYWQVDEASGGGSGTYQTYIDFEWVEFTTAQWAAIVAAVSGKEDF
jgi:hypothetical protein